MSLIFKCKLLFLSISSITAAHCVVHENKMPLYMPSRALYKNYIQINDYAVRRMTLQYKVLGRTASVMGRRIIQLQWG